VISLPTRALMPLSLTHVKIDASALELKQASQVAQNTIEVGSGVQDSLPQ
jgi:hypothetical protein